MLHKLRTIFPLCARLIGGALASFAAMLWRMGLRGTNVWTQKAVFRRGFEVFGPLFYPRQKGKLFFLYAWARVFAGLRQMFLPLREALGVPILGALYSINLRRQLCLKSLKQLPFWVSLLWLRPVVASKKKKLCTFPSPSWKSPQCPNTRTIFWRDLGRASTVALPLGAAGRNQISVPCISPMNLPQAWLMLAQNHAKGVQPC